MSSLIDGAVNDTRGALREPDFRHKFVTIAAVTMIVIQLAFRSWAVYGGWFFGDDLVFLADVARGDADAAWLFHRHNVHFMPLGFLLVLPVAAAGAFAWGAAATEVVIFQAAASLSCYWMLRTLFGNRLKILAPLAFYLFAAISMPALMWWAAALNMITVQPFIFGAITTHFLYLRTRRKRFALAAGVLFAFALSAYVKGLMIPIVLGIFTLAYFATGSIPSRLASVLRRYWVAWVIYGAIGITYLLAYFGLGSSPADDGKVDYVSLVQHAIVANLGTGLLGGPWNWLPASIENGPRLLSDPLQLMQTSSLCILVLLAVYMSFRYKGALKPLWFIAPVVLITVGLLAEGRVATFGTAITMEIRFWTDSLPYLSLAIAAAAIPIKGSLDPLTVRDPPIITATVPGWLKLGSAVVFFVGTMYSSVTYVQPWHAEFETKSFVQTAQASLSSKADRVDLADENVPEAVMQGITHPYNLASYVLSPLKKTFRTPTSGNDFYVLNGYGQAVPGIASADLTAPSKNLKRCLKSETARTAQTIGLGAATYNYPFWMSITYRADSSSDAAVVAGSNWKRFPVQSGLHTFFLRTEGRYNSVDFYLDPGVVLCVDSIRIGQKVITK